MTDVAAKNRVIGIRHTLKKIKEAGLIEEDTLYPAKAVDNLQEEILSVAQNWYKIGAKRGALEILEAFLDGKFKLQPDADGKLEIVATKTIQWERRLNVTVGNTKLGIPKQRYKLTFKQLEFD